MNPKQKIQRIIFIIFLVTQITTFYVNSYAMSPDTFTLVAIGTSISKSNSTLNKQQILFRSCNRTLTIYNLAIAGSTSDSFEQISSHLQNYQPNFITVEYAINDASILKMGSLKKSQKNMHFIFSELKQHFPDARIYLLVTNPAFGLKKYVRPFLGKFVEAHKMIAKTFDVQIIDSHEIWEKLPIPQQKELLSDNLHPTTEGHQILSDLLLDAINKEICSLSATFHHQ